MASLREFPSVPNLEAEFDTMLDEIGVVGVQAFADYVRNPHRGEYINSRGEIMVMPGDTPYYPVSVQGTKVLDWIDANFSVRTYFEVFDNEIIRPREYTDVEKVVIESAGTRLGTKPTEGDLVVAWKNDPTDMDVPLPENDSEIESYDNAVRNVAELKKYSINRRYIPSAKVGRLPIKLRGLIDQIRNEKLQNLGVSSYGAQSPKAEDYGTYFYGELGRDIVRLVVLSRISEDNPLSRSNTVR